MTGVTRHEFLLAGATASMGWLLAPARAAALFQSGPPAGVARIIRTYDAQGFHRTGTDVDDTSGAWLAEEARAAGAETALARFPLARVDVRSCSVTVAGKSIDGLPLFDGGFTGAEGVAGHIGTSAAAEIALVDLDGPAISSEGRSIEQLRRAGTHRAIVAITRGSSPGLIPMNAYRFVEPYGVPVVQVASTDGAWLHEAAKRGDATTVVAHAVRIDDTAANVVATVRGSRPELTPVVVITPRSGWWNCASERGGGVACWIVAMRAAARAKAPRTIQFVASSGHELGHIGLDAFIARRADFVKSAHAWIHLGANIGAAGGRMRLQASDDQMEASALAALGRASATVADRVPRGTVPAGEARNIHVAGGRYASLLGSGQYFHSVADRFPVAVDAAAVDRYAAAVADLVVTLAQG
jgi:hypothetical protein